MTQYVDCEEELESQIIRESQQCINQVLSNHDARLADTLLGFMQDGKNLRPFIVAYVAQMLNGDRFIAANLAASVEMYHNATLIFDDIQDNSLTRRGRPTLNAQFGVGLALSHATALRALMTQTYTNSIPDSSFLLVSKWVNRVAVALSMGQYCEMSWSNRRQFDVSARDYLQMARNKTGSLLGLSAVFGAIAADYPDLERLFEIGCDLGTAYQILDDISNIKSGLATKDSYSDIIEKKITLMVLYVFERDENKSKTLKAIYSKDHVTQLDIKEVVQILQTSGSIDYCSNIAFDYLNHALEQLTHLAYADKGVSDKFILKIKEVFQHA